MLRGGLVVLVWMFWATAGLAQTTAATDGSGDTKPIPDPTVLTTQQLDRALLALENEQNAKRDGLEKVVDERFKGNDRALEAALASAKEAVSKTEANFTKQIDDLGRRLETATKVTDTQIGDIKQTLAALAGQSRGSDDTWSILFAVFGVVGLIGGLIIGAIGLRRAPAEMNSQG